MTDVDRVGERIEQLLGGFSGADAELAEELVHTLLEFYGAGLARIVAVADRPLLDRLAEDDLVRGLLVLHDLHPKSTHERVTEALDKVRPYLGSHAGDVEFVGIEDGVLRLRLQGTCDGCPSSTVTAKYAIERVVREAAPEISDVVVDGVVAEETGPGGRPLLPLEALECPVPAEPV
ncbi:NifU family protein [Amycolatopsis sp. cmx-4-68]|uniref:NifU family protein n=1 Tax=Amycolatopsis sp. cmx-4-68 TaxID=2790938 RepID=UPI00397AB7CC